MFHLTVNTHICTFCVKMAHLRRINVASVFSGFVILPVFWCITPELWQLLLLLSFHISSSLSTTLEIEIFCCRHFILVPSPRRPVNLPRRWENTTGLAIPFPLWKICPCFRKHRNAQKYREIRSLYWLKNCYWTCYSFSPLKICSCLRVRKHGNAQNTGKHADGSGLSSSYLKKYHRRWR